MKKTLYVLALLALLTGPTIWNDVAHAQTGSEVRFEGTSWVTTAGTRTVYTGSDMMSAIQAAINNLSAGRTQKQTVTVYNSGSTLPHTGTGVKEVRLASYTILDFQGNTIDVKDTGSNELTVPVRAVNARDIEIKNIRITGNPRYSIWIQTCTNVVLSQINISIPEAKSLGLGIRIDNGCKNVSLDYAYIEKAKEHGVETAGVDGMKIGKIETRETGGAGLLLQGTKNCTVDTVYAISAGLEGGYAAMRFANYCGPNVTVHTVIGRNCARGVFGVSGSNGITVNWVDLLECDQGMLIENCQNFKVNGGIVKNSNGEGVRIASRSDTQYLPSTNVTVQNLRVFDDRSPRRQTYGIRETSSGGTNHNFILNNDLRNGGTVRDLVYEGPGTVATGNILTGTRIVMNPPAVPIRQGISLEGTALRIWDNPNNAVMVSLFNLKGGLVYRVSVSAHMRLPLNSCSAPGSYIILANRTRETFVLGGMCNPRKK